MFLLSLCPWWSSLTDTRMGWFLFIHFTPKALQCKQKQGQSMFNQYNSWPIKLMFCMCITASVYITLFGISAAEHCKLCVAVREFKNKKKKDSIFPLPSVCIWVNSNTEFNSVFWTSNVRLPLSLQMLHRQQHSEDDNDHGSLRRGVCL